MTQDRCFRKTYGNVSAMEIDGNYHLNFSDRNPIALPSEFVNPALLRGASKNLIVHWNGDDSPESLVAVYLNDEKLTRIYPFEKDQRTETFNVFSASGLSKKERGDPAPEIAGVIPVVNQVVPATAANIALYMDQGNGLIHNVFSDGSIALGMVVGVQASSKEMPFWKNGLIEIEDGYGLRFDKRFFFTPGDPRYATIFMADDLSQIRNRSGKLVPLE
ncbi:MAG: hypothetical protein JW754_02745 [Candidatus Aenigmarchaeota archaeon]|nr:hypothetical protein [Candidatus Aenigmarchaeota archaeon]